MALRFRTCGLLRWRKSRKILLITTLFLLIFLGLYTGQIVKDIIHDMSCSEEQSHNVLVEYCQMYDEGRIVGDLCPDLCSKKNIQYKRCTNYLRGKRVFIVKCKDFCVSDETVSAVLKTHHKNFSDFLNEMYSFEREADKQNEAPSIMSLKTMITDTLNMELDLDLLPITDPIAYIWNENYMDYYKNDNRKSQFAVARSILSLIRQPEYLMMKTGQDQIFIPKIYGTCGPMYLMEYAPPGDMLEHELQLSTMPWVERAKVARSILEVVRQIDGSFHQPLHLCDVKGENFGVSGSQVKLIDTDTVFFNQRMLSELSHDNCTRNKDCDFFDCRGWCNENTKHCDRIRVNSNLQTVCQDVFLGRLMDTFSGLLRNPPRAIKARLKSVLEKCAYGQTPENGIPIQKPSDDIYWRLYNLLQNSIKSQR